jgi:endonuclease YncB( thermonuclease family)
MSSLKRTGSGRVDQVIDGTTLILKDKRIIRLTCLNVPSDERLTFSAREKLKELIPENTEVILYQTRAQTRGRVNRLDQHLAHIVRASDGVWMNGEMLRLGLARVAPSESNPELIKDMYQKENRAIHEKFGLWGVRPVLSPTQADQAIGDFAVIEGVIQKSALVKNQTYLNFGDDWKTDFTVSITPDIRKKLLRVGINTQTLTGRSVRVRGEVRSYNGAFLELSTPDSLEIFP